MEPRTILFIAPTNRGKTYTALNLLENRYRNHFEYIVIICPTIRLNKTYKRRWINSKNVFIYQQFDDEMLKKVREILEGCVTLFLIDDCISYETFGKYRSNLLDLATSGRHSEHSLWILTQVYSSVPKNIRRQAKELYFWRLKERTDKKLISDESDCIDFSKVSFNNKYSYCHVDFDNNSFECI